MKFLLVAVACLLAGCVPQMVMQGLDRGNYREYQLEMEKLNFEREKAGLQPKPIPTYNEWAQKPVSTNQTPKPRWSN